MKKILALLLGFSIIFTGCAFADEIKQVTSETLFYIKAVHTVPEGAFKDFSVFNSSKAAETQAQLATFLKSCQPYNENININFFGLDATFNIHSNGKVNEKCTYEITGKVNKIPESLLSKTGMPSTDIYSLEPKISCEFTQEQLNTLVDSMSETISEFAKDGATISKSQAKQNLKTKLANDEKITNMFKEGNVCHLTGLTKENL